MSWRTRLRVLTVALASVAVGMLVPVWLAPVAVMAFLIAGVAGLGRLEDRDE